MELRPGAVLNVGFGMPDGVIKVAREQGFADQVVATIEQGQIGGIPAEGLEFGAAYNATAIVETGQQFAFYHGRGVDVTFLGFAEVDAEGNVNVSKLGDTIVGIGGFIDISQKARKVVFCGTLAVRGKFEIAGVGLRAVKLGAPKFVERVRQVTFSGDNARATGQEVLYITEAAVFPADARRRAPGGDRAGARIRARHRAATGFPPGGQGAARRDGAGVVRRGTAAGGFVPALHRTARGRISSILPAATSRIAAAT